LAERTPPRLLLVLHDLGHGGEQVVEEVVELPALPLRVAARGDHAAHQERNLVHAHAPTLEVLDREDLVEASAELPHVPERVAPERLRHTRLERLTTLLRLPAYGGHPGLVFGGAGLHAEPAGQ